MEEFDNVRWQILLVVGVVVWFFTRDKIINDLRGYVFALFIWFAMFCSVELTEWVSRYYAPKIVVDDYTGSIEGDPAPVGSYAVFSTGYAKFPIPHDSKFSTVVVPLERLHKVGRNWNSNTQVMRYPLNKLPPEVCTWIKRFPNKYNKNVILFGQYSREFKYDDEKAIASEALRQDLEQQINDARDIIDGKNDQTILEVKKAKEMVADEGIMKKIVDFVKPKKENEE